MVLRLSATKIMRLLLREYAARRKPAPVMAVTVPSRQIGPQQKKVGSLQIFRPQWPDFGKHKHQAA
jgi:hypothetical protein